uniref:Interleukin-33 n=1 Tax=Callithrix jacchus TaxID=9483 RepID=A0A2R8NEP2_CALJA
MKPKMKYSTNRISTAKQKNTASKALCFKLANKVLLSYYESQCSSNESGDGVDGKMLMVALSPIKDFWLHANNKEHSVELHKCEKPLPDQAFFILHNMPYNCVSFECKTDPGVFIGVKDNHLALIKVDCSENLCSENILFKLSKS